MLRKGWFGGGLWKPKNPHSLEHLRYLYTVLSKNQVVQDSNRSLLVESLRAIAEILIWGDQNDSSVFDFFLEKNMLSFFLRIMKQKCGSYVCVQLLQTLNILFENIRNETSLYYLLSNNHVNSIIVHKFDFSDEEVMAYYISFLKTLSLKLNSHTIHFFYNEHTNDFPLYTEAIKFFNHPESMVRIAVRTLSLNVYKVDDEPMLRFIRDRTAAPYFSNLVWFIGNHILELDACVRNDVDHSSRDRLSALVAEHLDHLHYLNDILRLNITELNLVLADHLLNRLLVPLLVYSLNHHHFQEDRPRVSRVVALFLLAQVFLIFSYSPLMQVLARIIIYGDNSIFADNSPTVEGSIKLRPGFVAPEESLEKSLKSHSQAGSSYGSQDEDEVASQQSRLDLGSPMAEYEVQCDPQYEACSSEFASVNQISVDINKCYEAPSTLNVSSGVQIDISTSVSGAGISELEATHVNITDEEKEKLKYTDSFSSSMRGIGGKEMTLASRPFLQSVLDALNCTENDYSALFSLCLLYAVGHNAGINRELISMNLGIDAGESPKIYYNTQLVECLLRIISQSAQYNSKIRVSTLEMALNVLRHLIDLYSVIPSYTYLAGTSATTEVAESGLRDQHLAALEGAKEEATLLLRNFYKGEEIFLDMFEDEWRELYSRPLNVEYLLQDASILLPPAGTPLTGIDFNKRLPCGEVERARRSMRVFFLIRALCLKIRREADHHLPLTNPAACVQVSDVLDLNNSDLIACVVITRDSQRTRRFLVIDVIQMILVEPDQRRLGWGVAKFVGFLQDLEVVGDKDDSRVLHITIHRPSAASLSVGRPATPLLAAKFIFDDHIRCMAAKQRLTKGRMKARQRKLHQIARLLELPSHLQPCPSPPAHALSTMRQEAQRRGSRASSESRSRSGLHKGKLRGPGIALKREDGSSQDDTSPSGGLQGEERGLSVNLDPSTSRRSSSYSRSSSRSTSRPRCHGEEIPLENISFSLAPSSEENKNSPINSSSSPEVSPKGQHMRKVIVDRKRILKNLQETVIIPGSAMPVFRVLGQVPFHNEVRHVPVTHFSITSSLPNSSNVSMTPKYSGKVLMNTNSDIQEIGVEFGQESVDCEDFSTGEATEGRNDLHSSDDSFLNREPLSPQAEPEQGAESETSFTSKSSKHGRKSSSFDFFDTEDTSTSEDRPEAFCGDNSSEIKREENKDSKPNTTTDLSNFSPIRKLKDCDKRKVEII